MRLFSVFGLVRRVKRLCFIAFVVAAVYAGPRLAHDLFNSAGPDPTAPTASP